MPAPGRDLERVLGAIPATIPKYGVLGNHDGWGLYRMHGIEDVHGVSVETPFGFRIAGMQGSIRYKPGDCPMLTDEESSELANRMPGAELFICHDGPKKLHASADKAHAGLLGVSDYIRLQAPQHTLCGHHHIRTEQERIGQTRIQYCYGIQLLKLHFLLNARRERKLSASIRRILCPDASGQIP